jgi:hypothetical protein
MPDTLPEHYSTEFSTNWQQRVQQTKGRLDAFVEDESFMGERKRYDRINSQNSRRRHERKGPTIITDPEMDARWATRGSFELTNLLDRDDAMNLAPLVLPTSDLIKSHTNAYHRDSDDVAWSAAIDPVLTGENGTTETILPASQTIVHGSTGLTLAKLILANEILEDADLEDEQPRVLVVTANQLTDLLNTTEVRSADYNSVRALVNGEVNEFMGFQFKKVKRLPKNGTTRSCPGWVKGAIKRIKGEMRSRIDLRPDLSYSTQVHSNWHLGAVRVYDEGVIVIECTE